MSDDLNTAHILRGGFQEAMEFINVSISKLRETQEKQRISLVVSLIEVEKAVMEVLDVLDLLTNLSYTDFLGEMKQKALTRAGMEEEEVLRRIEKRRIARKNKEFKRSDQIGENLAARGISLMDIPGKDTVWRPCIPPPRPQPKSGLGKTALVLAVGFVLVGFFFYKRRQ